MEAAMIDQQALELAERDFREAAERVEELREVRNDMVRTAIDQGWTHARIAQATGLTRGRVGQLAQQD